MLSGTEKNDLYIVIKAYLGEDLTLKSYMGGFSDETLKIVEHMIADHGKCNMAIQGLITGLIGGSKIPVSSRWLKRILGALSRRLKVGKFNTTACRNVMHAKYRSRIMSSAI